jgi:hypothetical protein
MDQGADVHGTAGEGAASQVPEKRDRILGGVGGQRCRAGTQMGPRRRQGGHGAVERTIDLIEDLLEVAGGPGRGGHVTAPARLFRLLDQDEGRDGKRPHLEQDVRHHAQPGDALGRLSPPPPGEHRLGKAAC